MWPERPEVPVARRVDFAPDRIVVVQVERAQQRPERQALDDERAEHDGERGQHDQVAKRKGRAVAAEAPAPPRA